MTSLYQNLVEKDNTPRSFEILLTNITAAISSSNTYHDNIKLLFKGYHYAVNAKKGHEDLVLKFINIALRKNRFYYRCMESLTEYLLRMVRRNKAMREIMKEEDWKWLLEWWKENDVRPTMYQDTSAGVSLLKPGHPSSYGSHYSSSWDYRDRDEFRDTEMIRQRLERFLRAADERMRTKKTCGTVTMMVLTLSVDTFAWTTRAFGKSSNSIRVEVSICY